MQFEDLLALFRTSSKSKIQLHGAGAASMACLAARLVHGVGFKKHGPSNLNSPNAKLQNAELSAAKRPDAALGRSSVLIARNLEEYAEIGSFLQIFLNEGHDDGVSLAAWERPLITFPFPSPAAASGRQFTATSMAALFALSRRKEASVVLCPVDMLLLKLPPSDFFNKYSLPLTCGDDASPQKLVEIMISWGFVRVPVVTQVGEVSLRGDILDIYAPGYKHPLRVEFFGDSIEQIRMFDAGTQRSVCLRTSVTLIPVSWFILDEQSKTEAAKYWAKLEKLGVLGEAPDSGVLRKLKNGLELGHFSTPLLPGLCYEKSVHITSLFPADAVYVMPNEEETKGFLKEAAHKWEEHAAASKEAGSETGAGMAPLEVVLFETPQVAAFFKEASIAAMPGIISENILGGPKVEGVEGPEGLEGPEGGVEGAGEDIFNFSEKKIHSFTDLFPLASDRERPWHGLLEQIRKWREENVRIIFSFPSTHAREKFLNLSEQEGLNFKLSYAEKPDCYALVSALRRGVFLPFVNTIVLGEDVIQPQAASSARRKSSAFIGLDKHNDLTAGDFLVHRDYGVGRFEGLHTLNVSGVGADFLLLMYSGEDKFYLPVDRLSLVQRFKGPEGLPPVLDKLGGSSWQASKIKAQKAIEQIAHDLLEIYAYRKAAKGFSYGPVNEMYAEFEATFGFEETEDQLSAINEVLDDMDSSEPMDRLVCGDVGFGKTEVALRAAFRAAAAGKQVALLCPTTVLAEQHYKTFSSRLSGFGLNVGMLSRFVSRAAQKEVLEKAERGLVDVLIGTHRILSGDVKLPNLALLILDEEQRFGVRHKDKLKEFKKNVDVLTLTATPIPRTLQLSLAGIRGMSIIETAPLERKPVSSIATVRSDEILKEALEREFLREGQVFWVYNRVQDIERVAAYVQKLAPKARVGIAHGQMPERHLEDVMHKFWQAELDVLVCTAIIESGLDFPRANTLIVDGAHIFGLGQLYQLRGRVGRSDRQAYAIFVVPNEVKDGVNQLKDFRKRLEVLLSMNYLGAGFEVAMEDLRIRGAGNILGEAQSGHIAKVGLELYMEMLEDAVHKIKGEEVEHMAEDVEVNIGIPAYIPVSYIEDANLRLKYYKSLSIADAAKAEEIEMELKDRFGPLPEEVQNFLAVLMLKRFLAKLKIKKADIYNDKIKLAITDKTKMNMEAFMLFMAKRKNSVRFASQQALEYTLPLEGSFYERVVSTCNDLINSGGLSF